MCVHLCMQLPSLVVCVFCLVVPDFRQWVATITIVAMGISITSVCEHDDSSTFNTMAVPTVMTILQTHILLSPNRYAKNWDFTMMICVKTVMIVIDFYSGMYPSRYPEPPRIQ